MTADVKISALPATSTIGGTEIIPLVQNGVTSSATPSVLAGYFKAQGNQGTVSSVNISGGATGLTVSGGPITGVGTITLAGVLTTSAGGTNTTSPSTGTGGVVLSNGPTLVSPILGVISSGVATALTGVSLVSSIAGVLTTGNGGTATTGASTGTGGVVLSSGPTINSPVINTATLVNCSGFPGATFGQTYLLSDLPLTNTATVSGAMTTPSIGANGQTFTITVTVNATNTGGATAFDAGIHDGSNYLAVERKTIPLTNARETLTFGITTTLSGAKSFTCRVQDTISANTIIATSAGSPFGIANKATFIQWVRVA